MSATYKCKHVEIGNVIWFKCAICGPAEPKPQTPPARIVK